MRVDELREVISRKFDWLTMALLSKDDVEELEVEVIEDDGELESAVLPEPLAKPLKRQRGIRKDVVQTKPKDRPRARIYDPQTGEQLTTSLCPCCRSEVAIVHAERAGKDAVKCPNCSTTMSTEGV